MNSTEERRLQVLDILKKSSSAINGSALAEMFGVSRQVIVQDIAILKSRDEEIISTNRGYKIVQEDFCQRVFKVSHSNSEIESELECIVDFGAHVRDVFVWHKAYGKIQVDLDIKSRRDIKKLIEEFNSGISRPLNILTEGYHYHTISADTEEVLDELEEALLERGFLVGGRDV